MNRRRFLGTAATGGTALLSGCLVGDRTPTAAPTRTPADDDAWHDRATFADVDREVYVEAERYRFIPGTESPIRVRAGERVGLAVTALDDGYHSGHGIYAPAFDIDLQALPGGVSTTTFRAEPAGRYEVWCDVYCGAGHEEMEGTLVVEA